MVPPVQYGGDEVSAIVLDIGSYSTKAGYAGEDCPKAVFPTSYAIIPSSDGTDSRTYSHGNNINLYRPHAILANPIADGLISDWDALSRTLDHAFRERMRLDHLKDFPLLVTESSWNTKENREKMLEVAFEEWETPAYYSVDKSVMSAFASSKGSGFVIDVGHELTSVVPIYDGFVLRKGTLPPFPSSSFHASHSRHALSELAIQKQPAAGALISSILLDSLKKQSPAFPIVPQYLVKSKTPVDPSTPANAILRDERMPNPDDPNCSTTPSYHRSQEMRVMHEFKESTCEILPSTWDDNRVSNIPTRPFEFSDGYNAYFGSLRLSAPEILFNPSRFVPAEFASLPLPTSTSTIPSHPYSALQSLPRMIANSLLLIDPDLQTQLLNNIVLVGGTTLTQGFSDRFNAEMASLLGNNKFKITAPAFASERMYSSWLGGSILASLGTFHQLWIGADEYKEFGKSIINRRA